MPIAPSIVHDVLIAGAGPVGLFLACELRLGGASVLVLERSADPSSPLKRLPFGMRGLSAPTLEALYRRGILDDLLTAEHAADPDGRHAAAASHWASQARQPAGHFAGIQFYRDQIDGTQWPYYLAGPTGTSRTVALETLEIVLTRRALDLGAAIMRDTEVVAVAAEATGVAVTAAGGTQFRGLWLVGCDGGRSAVRKAAGFDFVGTEPEFTGYSVRADLADTEGLLPGRHYTDAGMYSFAPPGTIALADFDGGAAHRQPFTAAGIEAVLQRVSATHVRLARLHLASSWTDRAFQATHYRRGRVLLAGDAAHVHSPLGGQGLNLGIGDAMNLGWKLAATVRGDAPVDLLDTYHSERHPVGAAILDWSRAQVALMRPTPSTRALAAIARDLIGTGDGATYVAGRMWGLTLRYDLGGVHPLVGRSLPEFQRVAGGGVGALLREGKGLLIDFAHSPALRALACRRDDRLVYIDDARDDRFGLAALLVRPDGIVAWASADTGEADAAEAEQAAARWFGQRGPGDPDSAPS